MSFRIRQWGIARARRRNLFGADGGDARSKRSLLAATARPLPLVEMTLELIMTSLSLPN